jgi:hypothetical protein
MQHASWLKIEASPFWHGLYRRYRLLPDSVRRPLRVLSAPRWHLVAFLVRHTAGRRVMAGPFRGMQIELSPLSGRHLLGYLLGSQELELHAAIEQVAERHYRTILNIGAADGYYAVGLATRAPQAHVEAFEGLPEFHPVIARTARANGVADRVSINGICTVETLRERLEAASLPTLIVMDIEGAEVEFLDPQAVPQLARADILVEAHDAFVAGATETLIARFSETHEVVCYTARPRTLGDFPPGFLPWLRRGFPRLAVELMNERRTGLQHWLVMTAKRPASDLVSTEAAGQE